MGASKSVLYQNAERTTLLIDIPGSIVHAQGPTVTPGELSLLSRAPLQTPFEVKNEPPEGKHVRTNTAEEEYHGEIRNLIVEALAEIRTSHAADWCAPRVVDCSEKGRRSRKRKRSQASKPIDHGKEAASEGGFSNSSQSAIVPRAGLWIDPEQAESSVLQPKPCLTARGSVCLRSLSDIYNRPFHNSQDEIIQLSLAESSSTTCRDYYIPSHTTFILSRIEDSISTFKDATARYLSSGTASAGPGQFDFILLDPPWPNASAKRASSYQRFKTVHDTEKLLLSMHLEDHIAPSGYVGIWVTNKQRIRNLFLPPGNILESSLIPDSYEGQEKRDSRRATLFKTWGVELVEEWIWIKTTAHGAPVTDLDSVWRKPYEIMLLAQKKPPPQPPTISPPPATSASVKPRRRIIAGVPDLHSRKPSLKEPIEPLMPDPTNYRALELFARNLTAGWWAWGDEVLKFNWEGAWARRDGDVDASFTD